MAEAYGPDSDPCDRWADASGGGIPQYLDDLFDVVISGRSWSALNPSVRSSSTYEGGGTDHDIELPADIQPGDTIIIVCGWSTDEASGLDWPEEWTHPYSMYWYYNASEFGWKKAVGDEGGTTIRVSTLDSNLLNAVVYVWRDACDPDDQPPEYAFANSGPPSKYPNPPLVTPTGGSKAYSAIGTMACYQNYRTNWPSNLPDNRLGSLSFCAATGEFDSATVDPSNFTLNTGYEVWIAMTIVIHPSAGGPSEDDLLVYHEGYWVNMSADDAGLASGAHDHDEEYAPIAHDHDETYALIGHDHDLVYAPIEHDHDEVYAVIAHDHALVDLSDVNVVEPDDGDVVTWVADPGEWQALPGGGGDFLPLAGGTMEGPLYLDNRPGALAFDGDVHDTVLGSYWTNLFGDAGAWELVLDFDFTEGPPPACSGTTLMFNKAYVAPMNMAAYLDDTTYAAECDLGTVLAGETPVVLPWRNLYVTAIYDEEGNLAWDVSEPLGAVALDDLTDATITDPQEGDLLVLDTGEWVNKSAADAGLSETNHDHDLVYAAIAHDHDLVYAAIAHDHDLVYAAIAHGHALDDLSDVYAAAPNDGDVLVYVVGENTGWYPVAAPPPGAHAMGDHSDVDEAPGAEETTYLTWVWDYETDTWNAWGFPPLSYLADVNPAMSPGDGDMLAWDDENGRWDAVEAPPPGAHALGDHSDVAIETYTAPLAEIDMLIVINIAGEEEPEELVWANFSAFEFAGLVASMVELNLDDLGDVDAAEPDEGDVLTWVADPGEWVPAAPAAGAHALDAGQSDVTITDVADGELLVYVTDTWINQTLAEAGIAADDHDHDEDYLAIGGKAADSDLLDSHDSAYFSVDGHTHSYLPLAGGAMSGPLHWDDGTAAAPGLACEQDDDCGFYYAATYIGIAIAGVGQIAVQDGSVVPVTSNDIDLGVGNLAFKNVIAYSLNQEDGTARWDLSGQITGASGTAGAPLLSFTADPDCGVFYAATYLGFSIAGTAQVKIDDGSISPITDNDVDLGTAALSFKNLYAFAIYDEAGTERFDLSGQIKAASGSAGAPAFAFSADTDCGLFYAATYVGLTIAGTAQVKFDDGTIAPVTDNDIDLGTSALSYKNVYAYKYLDDGGNAALYHLFALSYPGTVATCTDTGAPRLMIPWAHTIIGCRATLGTANTGASLIVDVHKDGTTIYTTQGNRPTIAASGQDSGSWSAPDVTAFAANSYYTLNVDQIGSTIAGADLVVHVWVKRLA